MKKLCVVGLAALLAAPMAQAGDMPSGAVMGYLTRTELDLGGFGKDDGIGVGVRGWASIQDGFFAHGEYQTTGLDGIDLESLRIGGGYAAALPQVPMKDAMWMAKAEIIDFGADTNEDGIGVHGGAMFELQPQLGLFGSLGYLMLNESDGFELNVGAHYMFMKDLAAVADLRYYMGSIDLGAINDFTVMELRVGVAYLFHR
ncbi:MAG: hypothetical protein ACT4PK_04645 [Gammaproteobacteria bacterium]